MLTLHFLNTDISGNGGYADDDDNDGVAAMSEEEDEIRDLVDEGEDDLGDLVDKDSGSTSGGAANDAWGKMKMMMISPVEPAANIESSSDRPRVAQPVAKEPDYGNHSLPPQLFDGPEALAKAIDIMDRERMEDLIRQAQAAVKDLENIGAC